VYGSRVATDVQSQHVAARAEPLLSHDPSVAPAADEAQATRDLRNVMYANVGLLRNDLGLREALTRVAALARAFPRAANELRNLLIVGRLIAEAALARKESRGSHYRTDFPATDDHLAKRSFTRLTLPV